MNHLFLYVDTNYIVAALRDGNEVVAPIRPTSGDEYFELFFREDTEYNRVIYGNVCKNAFYKGEPHCFGNVFRLMAENTRTFSLYGRKQPISHLFKEAGILNEWKERAREDAENRGAMPISTYISFSADVDYAARNIFVEQVLGEEGFHVGERTVPIEHLALEHAVRLNKVQQEGTYLVLNAYNEHLHFSIYRRKDGTFVRLAENTLPGLGTDPRVRALVEIVVAKINNVHHFLSTPEQKEREYCNLEQYAEGWLRQLDATRGGRPLHITGVRFSVAPNTFDVSVTAEEVNGRTEIIVRDVVNEISNFVIKTLSPGEMLRGILFLGDGFANHEYAKAVTASYRLREEDLIYFRRCDLSGIIPVYRDIDLDQFKAEAKKHHELGDQELTALRNAQAEAEREREAKRQIEEKAMAEAAARKDKENYFTAMAKVEECEQKKEWHGMHDWAENALQLRPNDAEATAKLALANRNLAEAKVRGEQFMKSLKQAEAAVKERNWQEALIQAKAALNAHPDSEQAKKILADATKQIEQATRISEFFTRAAVFEQQGNYHKALEELEKVQFLDPKHPDLQPRMSTCRLKISERERKIFAMKQEYTRAADRHDHDKAAECARRLAAFLDPEQQSEWIAREEQHKRAAEAEQKQKEFIDDCTKHYNKAWFDGDWATFARYAEEVLRCRKDDELAERVERAKERVRAERDRRQFEEALERVKVLIADRSYKEARSLLEALRADATAPHQHESVTRLFKRIFDEEDQKKGFFAETTQQSPDRPQLGKDKSENTAGQPPKGKQQPPGKHDPIDPFFRSEATQPAKPTQQSPDRPQQGRGKSPNGKGQASEGADPPSGKGDFFDPFFGSEASQPAAPKKNEGAKTKPTPDNKQKKGPKNETTKGNPLDEFNKF